MVEIGLVNESGNKCCVLSNSNTYELFQHLSEDLQCEYSYRQCLKSIMELIRDSEIDSSNIAISVKVMASDEAGKIQDANWVRGLACSILSKGAGHYLAFAGYHIYEDVQQLYKDSGNDSKSEDLLNELIYSLDNKVRYYLFDSNFLKNLKIEPVSVADASKSFKHEIEQLWDHVNEERESSREQWLKTSEMGCLIHLAGRILEKLSNSLSAKEKNDEE